MLPMMRVPDRLTALAEQELLCAMKAIRPYLRDVTMAAVCEDDSTGADDLSSPRPVPDDDAGARRASDHQIRRMKIVR